MTSTRVKNLSVTSVLRWVKEKMTSTIRRAPLSGEGCTSTPVKDALRPNCSPAVV